MANTVPTVLDPGEFSVKLAQLINEAASRLPKNGSRKEDVAQNALWACWKQVAKLRSFSDQKLASYIRTAVRRHYIDELRKIKVAGREPRQSFDADDAPVIFERHDRQMEIRLMLSDALTRLEADEQEFISLRYFQELSVTEILELMRLTDPNITRARVYELQRRALFKLGAILA